MHSEYYNLTSLYVIVNVPDPELYCDSNFKAFFSIQKNGFCFIRYFKRVAVYGHTNYGHRFFPNISKPLKPLAHDYSLESFKEVAAWPKQRLVLLLTMTQLFDATGRAERRNRGCFAS